MSDKDIQLSIGQRVRIYEEEEPPERVGKMAIVESIESPVEGEPSCVGLQDKRGRLLELERQGGKQKGEP